MSEHNECVKICDHINTDNDDIEDEDNCHNLAAARIDVDACVDDIRVWEYVFSTRLNDEYTI